jgi:hypothetical protein
MDLTFSLFPHIENKGWTLEVFRADTKKVFEALTDRWTLEVFRAPDPVAPLST